MNGYDAFDQSVADYVASEGNTMTPSDAVDELITATSQVRPLPRWLALIKEPPMRRSSAVAVGSPTVRLAAIALSTILLLVLAGGAVAGAMQLAGPPTHVVSVDGDGDFTTISAAVDAADDGDRILIRPGRYPEAVEVTGKDLEIRGDGPADQVVVDAVLTDIVIPEEEAPVLAFYLEDTSSTIADLSVSGPEDAWAIVVSGSEAAPSLEGLALGRSVLWQDGAAGTLSGSSVAGHLSMSTNTTPTIDDNVLETCIWIDGEGARPVLSGNDISGCPWGTQVSIGDGFSEGSLAASAEITGNTIHMDAAESAQNQGNIAVLVMRSSEPVLIDDNVITGDGTAIGIRALAEATISNNRITGSETGIWLEGDGATISQNIIVDTSLYGLLVHGSPALTENSVEGSLIGLNIGASAQPVLSANTFCGNETDVKLAADNPVSLEGNEVCGSVD